MPTCLHKGAGLMLVPKAATREQHALCGFNFRLPVQSRVIEIHQISAPPVRKHKGVGSDGSVGLQQNRLLGNTTEQPSFVFAHFHFVLQKAQQTVRTIFFFCILSSLS